MIEGGSSVARTPITIADRKIFLRVPYAEREEAKALGAGFEFYKQDQRPAGAPIGFAYIKPGALIAPFAKWRRAGNPFAPDPTELPLKTPAGKNAAAAALGSLGGRAGGHKGGKARAKSQSQEQLSAIGRKGAEARWSKPRVERQPETKPAETPAPDDDDDDDVIRVPTKAMRL
jgi:general stress protein YciG